MTELLLVRHGETDWNRDKRFQGHADPPLNEVGREQARVLAGELRELKPDAVYSSDLLRARETAEIVGEDVGARVVALSELREIDVGEWQGLTWAEIEQRFPEGSRLWNERGHGWEEGETYEQLQGRVLEALRGIVRKHPEGRVVVVGHGGTLRAVAAHCDGAPVAEHRRRSAPIGNCEIVRIAAQNGTFSRID